MKVADVRRNLVPDTWTADGEGALPVNWVRVLVTTAALVVEERRWRRPDSSALNLIMLLLLLLHSYRLSSFITHLSHCRQGFGVDIGVASYGALGHVPPPLDFQLVILGITRFTESGENVQKQRDFCAIFINFRPIFVIFLPTVFPRE